MAISINGTGSITGITAGGLPSGTVTPASLSTGAPSWDASGNLSTNSGYGSNAVAYGCRAWVNFNGSTAAIRTSGNVSSVTKNGTGDYTVNLTTAMPDANYGWATSNYPGASLTDFAVVAMSPWTSNPTSSALRLGFKSTSGTSLDPAYYCVAIFR
jgi:hypothetical protein